VDGDRPRPIPRAANETDTVLQLNHSVDVRARGVHGAARRRSSPSCDTDLTHKDDLMKKTILAVSLAAILVPAGLLAAEKDEEKDEGPLSAKTFKGLEMRGIGPAVNSGRIGDFAVHPTKHSTYYVAVSSGGVWKTVNSGTTWEPIFDGEDSYSIGCVTLDPNDPLVVWVGTGENNSQRSVSYGDGVYKSADGGKSWEKMGLEDSAHIAKILVDPRDSNVVYVAAQGPLWNAGGDRGLYKTTDGGQTWERSLEIDENTGVTDLWMDPRNPDVLYAAAYQRRRHVWTLIDGGPGSAIYKSRDAGQTWKKMTNGLPEADMGRIGLAVSPANPDVVYAIVEAADEGGFYRSTDAGVNWKKMSEYMSQSPQYYNEIIPDPVKVDRVYSMDTWMHVTEDGGKTFKKVGEKYKHVDNHALWIDPENTDYLLAGCDGGIYESFDRGATWHYKSNLSISQFYRVSVDNAEPFYNVYGGTQDNNTLGGPSRTASDQGIVNSDWVVTVGGDGYETVIDPEDPNVVYSQWQYGGLVRYDRLTGETVDIKPRHGKGEAPLRFNWDSPVIISPHSHTRLYFAAQILFRSDDRGDSWRAVSPDLSAQIDRNELEVMDRVWSVDAVAKNASTSFYGNIVSLDESSLVEGLIYVGTDDGLIQVTEDGGATWRKIESFPGVPARSYVSDIESSLHDADTVYASFDNHKKGDFKPYVLESTDRGRTWTSITGDLPERGTVYTLIQDHEKPSLMFAGTEFGVFFTIDGGARWIPLEGGLPPIAVRDLDIQRRESDLALATFGRGFYILDDYSPLRLVSETQLEQEAILFPVKKAWMFVPRSPLAGKEKANQGDSFFTAPNPPFGAVFTYYLEDEIKTRKETRREAEKKVAKDAGDVSYPSWDELRAEAREEKPAIVLTVSDADGNVVRRLTGPVKAGFHRVAWDLRYPAFEPTDLEPPGEYDPYADVPMGPAAAPGTYTVSLAKRVEGKLSPLGEPQTFSTEVLGTGSLPAPDRAAVLAFQKKTGRLQRAVLGAVESAGEAQKRIDHLKQAIDDTPAADPALADEARALEARLKDLEVELTGDRVVEEYNEPAPMSIVSRVQGIVRGNWSTTTAPTGTQTQGYQIAAEEFAEVLARLQALVETDLAGLEAKAEAAGAPWTPGRVPRWTPE
jgi:photosystem II stability/assembly factor-like uncharacterized protein